MPCMLLVVWGGWDSIPCEKETGTLPPHRKTFAFALQERRQYRQKRVRHLESKFPLIKVRDEGSCKQTTARRLS